MQVSARMQARCPHHKRALASVIPAQRLSWHLARPFAPGFRAGHRGTDRTEAGERQGEHRKSRYGDGAVRSELGRWMLNVGCWMSPLFSSLPRCLCLCGRSARPVRLARKGPWARRTRGRPTYPAGPRTACRGQSPASGRPRRGRRHGRTLGNGTCSSGGSSFAGFQHARGPQYTLGGVE
jgi:hypothetical protein